MNKDCDCKLLDEPIRFWNNDTEYVCEFDAVHKL